MASVTVAALSTTFTPPASCASQLLTLAPPKYEIWMNDPQPVEGSRVSACYPSQWIEQYTSSMGATTYTAAMMSPLVCPSAWTSVATSFANLPDYMACCPQGFGLTPPKTTEDAKRPAYGGTCYSPLASGSTYVVTKYDTRGVEGTIQWPATTVTDNAYAHPIDGYRAGAVRTTGSSGSVSQVSPTATSSGASNATNANGADGDNNTSASLSGGAIAGIVIGVVGGLALIAAAAFLLFRRRRKNLARQPEEAGAAGHAAEKKEPDVYEAPESPQYPVGELHASHYNPGELPNNHYVAELGPGERSELPSNYHGHELR